MNGRRNAGRFPTGAAAAFISVWALASLGAADLSLGEAERVLKDEQKNASALFSVSFYFEQAGRPFSALKAIERAVEMDGKVPGYHARYGQLLAQRRRLKEAGAAYGRAADIVPATKAFRAAQARSCAEAHQLKEAAAAWKTLLDGTSDRQEVLDAAQHLAQLHYQMNDAGGAESTWNAALAKLKEWNDRLQAAEACAQAMLAQAAHERAAGLWEGLFAEDKDWEHRATMAERLAAASSAAPAAEREKLLPRAGKAWQTLLESAGSAGQKQRAAAAVADACIRQEQPEQAVAALKPLLYAGNWDGNYQTAQALARAYAAQGDAESRKEMWREFMGRSGTKVTLQAGKRYAVKLEMFQGGGGAMLKLVWSSPSQGKELIPTARLFTSADGKEGDGLKAEYFVGVDLRVPKLARTDAKVDFTWTETAGPHAGVPATNVSARWTGWIEPAFSEAYTFYTVSDDGVRLWLDGKALIDNWTNHAPAEDNSAGFEQRLSAAQQLAALLEEPGERIALWREVAKEFSYEVRARQQLAEALAGVRRFAEALDVYEAILDLVRKQPGYLVHLEAGYWNRMVGLCGEANDPERATEYALKSFGQVQDAWTVSNWLSTLRGHCGEYAGIRAAEKIATAGGLRRLGAAQYLRNSGRNDSARVLLEAAAADAGLNADQRQEALQHLMGLSRSDAERTEAARKMVALGGEFWRRQQALSILAQCLGQEGRIEEAAEAVRQGAQLRQNNWSAGPNVLQQLAHSIFRGNRVGAGLRTPEGQEQAEAALKGLYKDFAAKAEYQNGLQMLASNLAELHARRGDYNGAVDLLRALCQMKEQPALRAAAAGLLERKGDQDAAFKEYFVYLLAAGKERAEYLRRERAPGRRDWLPGVDQRLVGFIENQKKHEDLTKSVMQALEGLTGQDREGLADVTLSFHKQSNRPEDMQALLKKLEGWGHQTPVYKNEMQWAEAAIKLKNSASQADTRMRDQLLRQVDQWKKTFSENPEDYQAALNVFKTYQLLGRRKDAEPFLAQAARIAPNDPLILELAGRQYMLDKDYAGAAKALAQAAQVTGRGEDYESTVLSALEVSGKAKEALALALDSLAEGRQGGRGVRTVEQVLDLAERTDNLKHLYAETKARVEAARNAKKPVREQFAQLALRLAWDHSDDALSRAALEELIRVSRNPATGWQEEWRLQQLAARALERRRIGDAIRVREALLDAHLARGGAPDAGTFSELASLLIQSGKNPEAADLVFRGLTLAARTERGVAGGGLSEEKPRFGRKQELATLSAGTRSPWAAMILELAAREAAGGGKEFRAACGERLDALVESEFKRLEQATALYAGPLTNPYVETAFGLRDRVTAAYQTGAAKPDASADAGLSHARRLAALATRAPAEARDQAVTFEQVRNACAAAAKKAEAREKRRVAEACAEIQATLLNVPEKERLAGVTPDAALEACEAASGAPEGVLSAEVLRRALALAQQHRKAERAVKYARELQKQFPTDREARYTLAGALLAAGQAQEAVELLRAGFDKFSTYGEYARAGDACITPPPDRSAGEAPAAPVTVEAAAGAVEFYSRAIALYLEEVGPQVDAQGRPLPDGELGRMQAALSKASASAGKLEDALTQLLASVFNFGGEKTDEASLARVAEAYARGGKMKELLQQLEAKVAAEPKKAGFRLAQATALEQAGEFGEAAKALRAAKALDPQLSTVKRLIADLRKARDLESALEECQMWAGSFPRDAEVYKTMAEIHKDLKDEAGEVRALTMLVEAAPRDADNCRTVAVLLAGRKDYGRATGLLERAIELRPEEPYRQVDLAEARYLAGDFPRAEAVLKEALTRDWEKGLSPELLARMPPWRGTFETRAHSLLGDVYEALKQPEAAARERMNVPAGYQRPPLEKAAPVPGPAMPRWPMPMPMQGGRGRRGMEE
jgi:tetratricopeptide (TPR) repeat protein